MPEAPDNVQSSTAGQGLLVMVPLGLRFHPGKASTLVIILLFPFLISLGAWQLDRAQRKLSLHSQMEKNRKAPALRVSTASELAENLTGRSVQMTGQYESPTLLLDNRLRGGRSGYEIITPFKLDDGTHLLVARGWIVADPDRARFPDVALPTQPVTLTGRVGRVPAVGIRLDGSSELEQIAPAMIRVQRIETGRIAHQLGYPLPSGLLYLDPAALNGYDRTWPAPVSDVSKHHAYAVQWFAMAIMLLLLYLKISFQRESSRDGA